MTVENTELYSACKAYLFSALRLLRERCGDVSKLPREEKEEWNDVDGTIYRQRRSKPDWAPCIRQAEAEMHATPEYNRVIEQLNADPKIARHLDALVGAGALGSSRVEASGLADSFVWRNLNRVEDFVYSEETFEEDYTALEAELYSDTVESVTLMPLAGFRSDVAPLILTDQVSVVELGIDEIRQCIRAGFIHPVFDSIVIDPPRYGIQIYYSLPKVIRRDSEMEGQAEQELKAAQEFFNREDAMLEAVLAALRVFRSGGTRALGKLSYGYRRLSLGDSLSFVPGAVRPSGDYILSESEAESFVNIWQSINSPLVKGNKSLSTAIRRFNISGDRDRLEDRMLDLMIAGEALFLSETTEELRYRFALRAASFIEVANWSREQVFRFMRLAYDVRSKIAHGDDLPKLSIPNSATADLQSFLGATEDLLRLALHRALEIAGRAAGAWPPNWDEVILFSRIEPLNY